MTFHQELAKASPPKDTVLTIGTFDGVHLGHRELLRHLKAAAGAQGLLTAVLTFRNHPRLVLKPGLDIRYINTHEDRVALLKDQGIDVVISVEFTRELSLLTATEFMALLSAKLRVKGLVVGPDFALGHGREGDIPTLQRLGAEMEFWVESVGPVSIGTAAIKSSVIRGMIGEGDVEGASAMLGRRYSLTGTVVRGESRGQTLGFPTANLSLDPHLVIPADGIYATWAMVEGQRYRAATSIGVRPTFGEGQRTVEAFLMEFQGDLYGKSLTLEFARRLRDELAFSSVEDLVAQMKVDVEQAHAALSSPPPVLAEGP